MMKRIFIAIASLSLIATGCLKDKDNNYGIPDGEVKGISFPRTQMSFGAQADATPQVIPNVVLGLNVQRATTVPVEYTVVSDPTLLAGTGLTAVPASAFTFQATGTIDPGNYVDTIQASLTNASLLDPNITYGIGFRITATSAQY